MFDVYEGPIEPFEGELEKIRLISNAVSYGSAPKPEDEVEQRITVRRDGRVNFTGVKFGDGLDYKRGRRKSFTISPDTVKELFDGFKEYFAWRFDYYDAYDLGAWNLTLTNTEGKKFRYGGALNAQLATEDGILISNLLRDSLRMGDLYAFDGCRR